MSLPQSEPKKRINPVAKGRRNEARTAKYLQERGFVVQTTVRSSYKGANDFFGLFDHIAVAYLEPNRLETRTGTIPLQEGMVFFVQTKSNRKPPKTQWEKMVDFPAKWKLVFVWKDRQPEPDIYKLPYYH